MSRVTLLTFVAMLVGACGATAGDWPYWRGPEQNGMTREKAVVTSWSLDGDNLLWKSPVGGRSTLIVMNGRVYGVGSVGHDAGRQERVFCLNAETGRMVWEHRFNVFHTTIVENRVGWTSPCGDPETGNIYVHGTGGEMFCFDRDGRVVWKRSMTEEFGRISGYGGRLHTPIVDEDRVIVSYLNSSWGKHARPLHRYVAFDKRTGDVLWWAAPGGKPLDTTYSSPVVAVIGGVRMLIAANADGNVYGMKARTGEKLWTFRLSKRGLNVSVVVVGNHVFVGHSEENLDNTEMGRVVCIDATGRGDITTSGEVWRLPERTVGYASPAVAGGRLYVIDNSANLYALDAHTGRPFWRFSLGRVGKGSPVVTADGVIYVGEQTGVFHILRDEGDKCVSLDRQVFTREDNLVDEFYGSPAVSDGRVYFMTRYGSYCLGQRGAVVETVQAPPAPRESTASAPGPGILQIVPAEITLAPGESVKFSTRRFDALGRRVDSGWVPLTPTGIAGKMGADGTFTAATDRAFAAGHIIARADGLEAKARIRISPKPPFTEDFESMPVGSVPPGWVGFAKKTKIVEKDGGKVLRKLASKARPSPPFMRLRGYATPVIAGGCTVEADILGTPKGKRVKPDMGLINTRYRMVLMGMRPKLRIESWSPMPRIRKDVPFKWEANQWYHVKFDVKERAGEALLRGKVWPRGAPEPDQWNIELSDPYPNTEGSAGLYGYSTLTTAKSDGPEIYYDNFQVTRND